MDIGAFVDIDFTKIMDIPAIQSSYSTKVLSSASVGLDNSSKYSIFLNWYLTISIF
jgi:hypothetical protein